MTFPGLVRANNLSDVVDREKAWDNLGSNVTAENTPNPIYALIINGNGTNGSTSFPDQSIYPNTVQVFGNTQISTSQGRFGGSSILFDGAGDYLQIQNSRFAFGASDFTLEFWVYFPTAAVFSIGMSPIYIGGTNGGVFAPFSIRDVSGLVTSYIWGTSAWSIANNRGFTTVIRDTWLHWAISRTGSTWRTFENGIIKNEWTNSQSIINPSGGDILTVARASTDGIKDVNCFINGLRITVGDSLYQSSFSPPQEALTSIGKPFSINVKGRDILALDGIRNTSTRDFAFIKGLTATAQPRITTAANNTASGVARRDLAMPKLTPTTSGNYFFSSGLTLSGVSTRINGTPALSIATSPFSGSAATAPLLFRELRPQANWRITESMTAGTIATPELAIPFETNDFVLYMKAGQN